MLPPMLVLAVESDGHGTLAVAAVEFKFGGSYRRYLPIDSLHRDDVRRPIPNRRL